MSRDPEPLSKYSQQQHASTLVCTYWHRHVCSMSIPHSSNFNLWWYWYNTNSEVLSQF